MKDLFGPGSDPMALIDKIGSYIPGGFFVYRAKEPWEILYVNDECIRIYGCSDLDDFKSLTGNTFRGMVHPEDFESVSQSIDEQTGASDDKRDYVAYRIVRRDGSLRWLEDYGHFADTADGGVFFVFISDRTEAHERSLTDERVNNAVIETLTKLYNTLCLINDVETESCSLYRSDKNNIHAEAISNALSHAKYRDVKEQYVSTMVAPEDRERMREQMSLPYILKQFEEKDSLSVTFLRTFPEGKRYYRIDMGKVSMPNGHTGVIMGFMDVDDEIRKDREYRAALEEKLALQDQILEEEQRRKEQSSMITAMASDYRSVYHVDLDHDDAVCYRASRSDTDETPEGIHFSFSERFTYYANKYVDEEYREGFLRFIDPDNIREALSTEAIIAYRYLAHRAGRDYYEMLRMAGVRKAKDRDDHMVHAVGVGFTEIDAEMRQTLEHNRALNLALAAAKEANRAKTTFLTNMSHEIRTPMNAILGFDSLALRDETLSPATRDHLEKIGGSARHLLGLINDILDMSRIESGRMLLRHEEFSFRSMVEEINSMVTSQCRDKGLKYECRITGVVNDCYIGDDMKLKQVILNTLSNAIKFTDPPGSVSLTIRRKSVFEDRTTLCFNVKDTGVGMDPEFAARELYEPFTQEDTRRSNKYGSTGLGMAITKNILELMNGNIEVVSTQKGVGTEFMITVTLKNCEAPAAPDLKDLRILAVCGDPVSCERVRETLDEAGIRADSCQSCAEALELLDIARAKQEPYQLALVDRDLTGPDGPGTVRELRGHAGAGDMVILLASYDKDPADAEAAGADGCIGKPLFVSEVTEAYSRIAGHGRAAKQRASLSGRRILLAEDVLINAEIVAELMEIKDASIDHAENGAEAVKMFAESEPGYYDAILMDVLMPEMTGLQAAAAIRKLPREDARAIPIIAMTANAFDEDVQSSLQAGMNAHLSKPVAPERLYETLEELIWEREHS
ncbi:MAG: response regulator [Abditibacteriota bacterium]|nr:response regulator [Abditibacteriota bacterium]